MHFNVEVRAIATPQRKANYNDKGRLRRKDLKDMAFQKYGVKSTAQIKKFLKLLGVKLDLRLTAAWDAVVFELRKSILGIIETHLTPVVDVPCIGVGAKVNWDYPMGWGHCDRWQPFTVQSIVGDMVQLDILDRLVPLSSVSLAA